MRHVRQFGRFWYDFLVGDDWRIAAGVVAALASGAVLVSADAVAETIVVIVVAAAIVAVVVTSVLAGATARRR